MIYFTADTPMVERLSAFREWLALGHCRIKELTSGRLVPLVPNALQRRIFEVMYRQAFARQPLRLIGLKARKGGFSTMVQAIYYFLCQHTPHTAARTIAHTAPSTQDIFEISQRFARNRTEGAAPKLGRQSLTFPHDSRLDVRPAGGVFVSSSATVELEHLSEMAKWAGTKNAVRAQLASILNCVPPGPHTSVVIESTANMLDVSGVFKEQWLAAKTGEGGYVPLFSPWFEEESYSIARADLHGAYDDYEQWLIGEFHLNDAQLAWRRKKIYGDYGRIMRWFAQDYPATEEEAFQAPSGLIFYMLKPVTHHWSSRTLAADGYRFFRGIDFGGADPFVCLWVAHKPGPPRFTVDTAACPNTWRELTGYGWGENSRPRDEDDHTCDALRYIVTFFGLTGHVHVYRELYKADSAVHGLSLLDLAQHIHQQSAGENVIGTVADRSQPGSITLLNQQRLSTVGYKPPDMATERGEKLDGIAVLEALMLATQPLIQPAEPQPYLDELLRRRALDEADLELADSSMDLRVLLDERRRRWGRGADGHELDPIYGAYG